MSELRLALATFDNVFDTSPNRRVVSIDTLVEGLSRFELRDDTAAKIRRRQGQIERAYREWAAGGLPSGKEGSALLAAARKAEQIGEDPRAAVEAKHESLLYNAHHDAKRLIGLWSPACYKDGAKRGSDDVLHLSCLGLDYDRDVTVNEVRSQWDAYFHIVHTTWSHTTDSPRLRCILPLARPHATAGWANAWSWAAARAGEKVDPAVRSPGATFALPAVPSEDAPRLTWVQPGELLDLVALGFVDEAPPPAPVAWHKPHHFDGGRLDKRQLRGVVERAAPPPVADDDLDFDAFD